MGLEEHLLTMFREDFEFCDENGPSHLAAHSPRVMVRPAAGAPEPPVALAEPPPERAETPPAASTPGAPVWTAEAERELKKIPFFVRAKARRNTEAFAAQEGRREIDLETLYEAKAHYAR
jgi:light-independent protochlorophyllide reductase subunit B